MIAGTTWADVWGAVLENDLINIPAASGRGINSSIILNAASGGEYNPKRFTRSDDHYTNGLRISWLGERMCNTVMKLGISALLIMNDFQSIVVEFRKC